MTIQLSVAARNALLDAIETTIGTSAIMKLYTGSMPSDCAQARTGTVVATLNLPSDWWANAASGAKAKSGTWQDTSADANGTIGYFTIFASDGTTVHMQGTCGLSGSGADMILDNTNVQAGQAITITSFTLTAPGA